MSAKSSRRSLLRFGASGVALALAAPLAASERATALPLITKAIPSTGERIPAIGLGTIWFREDQYEDLRSELARMVELGGRVVDTAAAYGQSEAVIGRAAAEQHLRAKLFIATKFDSGRMMPPPGAAPPRGAPIPGPPTGVTRPAPDGVGGAASFERSQQRLHTDRIDLLQVHGLNGTETLMSLLIEWKRSRRIRYLGVTTSATQQHDELLDTMRRHPLDFIQVDYSIGNRDAAEHVLPLALERKIAVLANLPLGRATLLQQVAGKPLPGWAQEIDVTSWGQFLLKYVISHPAVTCAVPGSLHIEHLIDNQGAGRGRLPDAATRVRVEEYWLKVTGTA